MKRIRKQAQPLTAFATFVVAILVITISLAAIPAQAQIPTPTILYGFQNTPSDAAAPFGNLALRAGTETSRGDVHRELEQERSLPGGPVLVAHFATGRGFGSRPALIVLGQKNPALSHKTRQGRGARNIDSCKLSVTLIVTLSPAGNGGTLSRGVFSETVPRFCNSKSTPFGENFSGEYS